MDSCSENICFRTNVKSYSTKRLTIYPFQSTCMFIDTTSYIEVDSFIIYMGYLHILTSESLCSSWTFLYLDMPSTFRFHRDRESNRRHLDYGRDAISTRPCFHDKNLSHSTSLSLCLHIAPSSLIHCQSGFRRYRYISPVFRELSNPMVSTIFPACPC